MMVELADAWRTLEQQMHISARGGSKLAASAIVAVPQKRSSERSDRDERLATHSVVSSRPAGRLHRPDDTQAEPREDGGSHRAAAFVVPETPGSPRLR